MAGLLNLLELQGCEEGVFLKQCALKVYSGKCIQEFQKNNK